MKTVKRVGLPDGIFDDIKYWKMKAKRLQAENSELKVRIMENEIIEKAKFAILDFKNKDFAKDINGEIKTYETLSDAVFDCGMYEPDDAWIVKLVLNYKENQEE